MEGARGDLVARDRTERRFLVPASEASALEARVALLLRRPCDGTPPEQWMTTVYLDFADRRLSRRAREAPERCAKVRLRAYPGGRSVAAGLPATCVLEVKRRTGARTRKWRDWLTRAEAGALVREAFPEVPRRAARVLRALGEGAPRPVVVTSCLRSCYESPEGVRVTFDREVAWHRPAPGMLAPDASLGRAALPPPVGGPGLVVVELKHRLLRMPPALDRIFAGLPPAASFSKFVAALESLAAAERAA